MHLRCNCPSRYGWPRSTIRLVSRVAPAEPQVACGPAIAGLAESNVSPNEWPGELDSLFSSGTTKFSFVMTAYPMILVYCGSSSGFCRYLFNEIGVTI